MKIRMPSEVCGSLSPLSSGVWIKKPVRVTAVTMPWVLTSRPFIAERLPVPWIAFIAASAWPKAVAEKKRSAAAASPMPAAAECLRPVFIEPFLIKADLAYAR